jgi:hypothetical protein
MRSVRINLSPKVFAGRRIAAIDELKGVARMFALLGGGAERRLPAGAG